uniref:PUM-HD domain-containing protein n=1 Tax=Setaria italica TaxID=4555 RepID=K4AL73_SETIT
MGSIQQSAAAADSTKAPAPINPAATAADLGAYFRVMRLGDDDDDSSPLEQQPKPQPPQVPLPTTRAEVLMQQLQAAGHYRPQPQNYCVGESSTGAGYVLPYASYGSGSFYASHFGAHSPRLNAAAAHTPPPVTPKLDAGAGHFVPAAPSHPSVESHSSSTLSPSPSASNYQLMPSAPQLGAASFPWDGNSSLNPYASAFQSTLSAYPADYRSWIPTPARRYYHPTLEQVRLRLLRRPMEPDLLMFPGAAGHVASLLVEGDEQVRRSVLARVRCDVGCVTGSKERRDVLLALVRACAGRPDELQEIVHAVYNSIGFLMGVEKHNRGLADIVQGLVQALAPYPQMLVQFICWLFRERLMEQYNGVNLLRSCFTTMSYEDSKIIIQFSTAIIDELLFSSFGSRCLAECLEHARNGELRALEEIILSRTVEIAMGQYSNYFLQCAIQCGSELLQVAITDRVAADVVTVSSDRFGSYVVEACFLLARTKVPLQRLLAAFQGLRERALAELVRGNYSNYVVSKLLDAGKNRADCCVDWHAMQHFPQEARALARRIERLPAAVQREMHARAVMTVVNKLTHRHLRGHAMLY